MRGCPRFKKGQIGEQFEYERLDAYGVIKTEVETGGPIRIAMKGVIS